MYICKQIGFIKHEKTQMKETKTEKTEKSEKAEKGVSLKTLTKSSVWDLQENDIFRLLETAEKDVELKENLRHYFDIIRSAFMIEELKDDDKLVKQKFTKHSHLLLFSN